MLGEITNQQIMWKWIGSAFGVIVPILLLVVWRRKTKGSMKPAVVGGIIFFVFSQILEGIPKAVFFLIDTPLSQYMWTHTWAYVTVGILLAGIFEETGRFVAFRFILRKYHERTDAIMYGIGHGGFESMLVLGLGGVSSMSLAAMINSGKIQEILSTASIGQQNSMKLQIAALTGYGFARMMLDILERIIAMTAHIALSVIVFWAVREKKLGYLLAAIMLHAFFDIPAALYQCGVLGLGVTEAWLLVNLCLIVWFARGLYRKMGERI